MFAPTISSSAPRLAYSPAEAAQALGVCRASIYNMIARGDLHVIKLGRSTRIAASELARLVEGDAA